MSQSSPRAVSKAKALDARMALLSLLLYFIAAFHARGAVELGLCSAVAIALAVASKLSLKDVLKGLRPLAVILVITVVMQVLYTQNGTVLLQLGSLVITQEALVDSASMLVCLLCVMVSSIAFMRSVDTAGLVYALAWFMRPFSRIGLRADAFVLSLNIAFRFIPVLLNEFRQLKKAQEARLADFDGQGVRAKLHSYQRLFPPLLRSSFRHSDMLAEAFVSRCFACGVKATSMREQLIGSHDVLLLVAACAVLVLTFVL